MLLNMIEHFKKSLQNYEYVACLGMDLSKEFDYLYHCLVICKLYAYVFFLYKHASWLQWYRQSHTQLIK